MSSPEDLGTDRLLSTLPRDSQGRPVLGGIALLRKLGSGGMATVYLGLQTGLKREVAVKILPFTLVEQEPKLVARFLSEARLAASLESEHLVKVLDVGNEHQTHYYVMQYVAGESAGSLLKRVRRETGSGLPEKDVLVLSIAACKGLSAAHAAGIVHRDIKPDNILIPQDRLEAAKIADLGLAKPEGSEHTLGTMTHIAMGTPGYMAPEQAENAKAAGPAADIFAMGATIYALLTAHPPFRGSSPMATLRAAAGEEPPPLPDSVSPGLRSVIDRALRKSPKDRYPDAASLQAALERVKANPLAVEISPRPRTKPAAPAPRKSAAGLWIGLAAAALGVAAISAVVLKKPGPKPESSPTPEAAATATPTAAPASPFEGLLGQAVRLEKDGQLDEAAATLVQAAVHSPDDPRLKEARDRIAGKIDLAKRRRGFTDLLEVVEVARKKADAEDTLASWDKVLELLRELRGKAVTDDDRRKTADLGVEAEARRTWAEAKALEQRGDLRQALALGRRALSTSRGLPGLQDWVTQLDAQLASGSVRAERKRRHDEAAAAAAAESDPSKALALWKRALDSADDPKDIEHAEGRLRDLEAASAHADTARKADEQVKAAEAALAGDRLDEAEALFKAALEIRADAPRAKDGLAEIALRRSQKEVDVALAEVAAAEKRKDPAGALAAWQKVLALRPADGEAHRRIAALRRGPLGYKVRSSGPRADLVLDEARKLKLDFVNIPPGAFDMLDDRSVKVTVTKPYFLQTTEVTQEQWFAVMGTAPSRFKGDRNPVDSASWWAVQEFIARVNARLDGWSVALPTEAQWENACRAGAKTSYSFGNNGDELEQYGWYNKNSGGTTHPVATKKPNRYGLYDMHGNLWEMTEDWNGPLAKALEDPVGSPDGLEKILRGSCWGDDAGNCRISHRTARNPYEGADHAGFRLVLYKGNDAQYVRPRRVVSIDEARKIRAEFVLVRAGTYWIGQGEAPPKNDEVRQEMTLTRDTWILETEVTEGMWEAVMGRGDSPTRRPDRPKTRVTWTEAMEFCRRLSDRARVKASLPTEVEWEIAARAGLVWNWTLTHDPARIAEAAWIGGRLAGPADAGLLRPNTWGLFDMTGNVAEWCLDGYAPYPAGRTIDPQGPKEGPRCVRGGSWLSEPVDARMSARASEPPDASKDDLGFRVILR